jgi:hypothetical protein
MEVGIERHTGTTLIVSAETSKEKLFDIISAILFFVVAVVELFAFGVAIMVRTH